VHDFFCICPLYTNRANVFVLTGDIVDIRICFSNSQNIFIYILKTKSAIGGAEIASTGKHKYGKCKYKRTHFVMMENASTNTYLASHTIIQLASVIKLTFHSTQRHADVTRC